MTKFSDRQDAGYNRIRGTITRLMKKVSQSSIDRVTSDTSSKLTFA